MPAARVLPTAGVIVQVIISVVASATASATYWVPVDPRLFAIVKVAV